MNYTGITKSNYVEVQDKEQLQDLVHEVLAENVATFSTYWDDDHFAIGSDYGPMHIEEDRLDGFLTSLGDVIAETMVIRSVGYEGIRYQPDAWQWIVYPNGEWEREALGDPDQSRVEVDRADLRRVLSEIEDIMSDPDREPTYPLRDAQKRLEQVVRESQEKHESWSEFLGDDGRPELL